MMETIGIIFLLMGTVFVLVAGIGVYRLPDVFMRMHASTKAGTLGVALIAVGAVFIFGSVSVFTKAIALIFFVLLTAPVAAHMIGRAAYKSGAAVWEGTFVNEWKEYKESLQSAEAASQARAESTNKGR